MSHACALYGNSNSDMCGNERCFACQGYPSILATDLLCNEGGQATARPPPSPLCPDLHSRNFCVMKEVRLPPGAYSITRPR